MMTNTTMPTENTNAESQVIRTIEEALRVQGSTCTSAQLPLGTRTLVFSAAAPSVVRVSINIDREIAHKTNLLANRGASVSTDR